MNLLFPKLTLPNFKRLLCIGLGGMVLGGLYGIVHDEITYTLCPEYFTRLKFKQFGWADLGLPERLHVAEIGFLATCCVGFFGVWFLARLAISSPKTSTEVGRHIGRGVLLMLAGAMAGGIAGAFLQVDWLSMEPPDWETLAATHGITDVPAFARVASIHNGSYLGGFTGLVAGLIVIKFAKNRLA
jgi:hypothetical protein